MSELENFILLKSINTVYKNISFFIHKSRRREYIKIDYNNNSIQKNGMILLKMDQKIYEKKILTIIENNNTIADKKIKIFNLDLNIHSIFFLFTIKEYRNIAEPFIFIKKINKIYCYQENIINSYKYDSIIKLDSFTLEKFMIISIQVLDFLFYYYKNYKFTHYNLILSNIKIRKLNGLYPIRILNKLILTKYYVYIENFSESYFYDKGNHYYKKYDQSNPIYDICTYFIHCYNNCINEEIKDLIEDFMKENLALTIKNKIDVSLLIKNDHNININFDEFILFFSNKIATNDHIEYILDPYTVYDIPMEPNLREYIYEK